MKTVGEVFRFARHQTGIAAIETALLLPVLLLLFSGLIDATAVLSDNRKVTYSTNVVADIVTRLQGTTTRAIISDSFKAAEIVMREARARNTRIEVHNYWLDNGDVEKRWQHNNGIGTDCGDPDDSELASLMTAGNDVLIVVVCADHSPIIASIFGRKILGKDTFRLRQQIHMRPRQSLTLLCSDC